MADTLDIKRNGRGSLNNLALEQELDDIVRQINEKIKQVTGQAKVSGLPEPNNIIIPESNYAVVNNNITVEDKKSEEFHCSNYQTEFYVNYFYKAGSVVVYLNGQRLIKADVQEEGNKIVKINDTTILAGDVLTVDYIRK